MTGYRELHPTKEGKRIYRFVTTDIVTRRLQGGLANHPDCDFLDAKGKLWAQIRSSFIHVMPGYAWNGCSPKRYIGFHPFGFWTGTPDFEEVNIASLIHDILFQFAEVGKYTFREANYQFLYLMRAEGFPLAQVYYEAVSQFGLPHFGHDNQGVKATYL